MSQTAEQTGHSFGRAEYVQITLGLILGFISFGIFSWISLWSVRGGEAAAPVWLIVLSAALVVSLLRAKLAAVWAFTAAFVLLTLAGYVIALGGEIASGLSFQLSTLLLHGGRSVVVTAVAGATLAIAFLSKRRSSSVRR